MMITARRMSQARAACGACLIYSGGTADGYNGYLPPDGHEGGWLPRHAALTPARRDRGAVRRGQPRGTSGPGGGCPPRGDQDEQDRPAPVGDQERR